MGFLKTGDTEMQVYLTEFGKKKMLEQSFTPTHFSINDSDVNYGLNTVLVKSVVDISGDYDDNIFSLSKWQNISGSIIRKKVSTFVLTEESANNEIAITA